MILLLCVLQKGLVIGVYSNGDEMRLSSGAQKFNDASGGKLSDFCREYV